ncbi:glutathione peroxidase [Serratia marcescens]|jgi:glutathione peroxidase|uniref:Glutathione peroxidase n=1 Tax=Serratia surfactantfaciens TaxID=2741499 RepID=A0ABS0LXA3_9GAMM|nr:MULTISPECIES: glutathione peroxidase [Serratia]AOE99142.1 glutathione peroxidase [Serratia surfactantfaciens]MBH1919937.1 glutathione peroxidase [Serratia surfactantfaciens]MBH2770863.1 glutathione peroxidase [Serratia marcescens]MBI6152940.1 glutathione peroxidase [Serratia surfactantfaciens]MDF9720345.1 glutathione peroxidase [Serratia marcescens]
MIHSLLSIPCVTLQGEQKTLGDFPARAYLVVNTASKCGFTPQYRGLENLWQYYRERGLMVLGFPCNQFGSQEPGSPLEIANFCSLNYGVSFPLFSKIEVNGPGAHPLFNELKRLAPGILGSRRIKWNFTKFLLTADGQRVTRFAPITKPERLFDRIETLLK